MPLYDYVCSACGTRFEVMHRVHESGPSVCSICGGSMRKALSSPAIVFKGSGWAKKDARAKPSGSGSASDKKDPSAPEPAKPAASGAGSSDD